MPNFTISTHDTNAIKTIYKTFEDCSRAFVKGEMTYGQYILACDGAVAIMKGLRDEQTPRDESPTTRV